VEDPYVSAVVHLRAPEEASDESGQASPVDDPADVQAEGAAVLAGTAPAPVSQRRFAGPLEIPVPPSASPVARVRGYFTSAGFEVHAPLGSMFSIGAGKSRFESFFGVRLVVDEERLGAPLTTESGERDLPTAGLPEERCGPSHPVPT
jgi:hypothetical protein